MEPVLNTLLYISVGVLLLIIGGWVFALTTKINEQHAIFKENNSSVAIMYGGKLVGMALVINSVATHSLGILDFIIYSSIGLLAQVVVYAITVSLVFRANKLEEQLEKGHISVGIFLASLSIGIGLILAGCVS